MVSIILYAAVLGIPTAFLVRLLWLDTVEFGFEGFFVHQRKFLHIGDHAQRVSWVDYIRQLFFNVYEVGDTWVLKENRQGLVRCTFCLSFWIAIPFAIALTIELMLPFYLLPLVHISIAGVSALLSDRM